METVLKVYIFLCRSTDHLHSVITNFDCVETHSRIIIIFPLIMKLLSFFAFLTLIKIYRYLIHGKIYRPNGNYYFLFHTCVRIKSICKLFDYFN